MADKMSDSVKFLLSLLGAVREVTGRRPPPTWTHVDKVQAKLGTSNTDAVDAAIRVAVKKGWLRSDGEPATSITLTGEGIKLLDSHPAG
jgi:hypothetical protein